MSTIKVTPESLNESAQKFRKELLMLTIMGMKKITPYFTVRTGILFKETVGTIDGAFDFRPYDGKKNATYDLEITGREQATFLGACVKEFEPYALVRTIYGPGIASAEVK